MLPLADSLQVEIEQEDPEVVHPCTASFHPAHEVKCGEPAQYVIVATCSVCELRLRYLCAPHCSTFLPNYVHNRDWCICNVHQAPHDVLSVTVRGL